MADTCVFTVDSPTTSRSAISAFDSPARRAQDLALAVGQLRRASAPSLPARRSRGRTVEQPPRHARREQRVAGGDDADRLDELLAAHVLEQEAARAGVQRARTRTRRGRRSSGSATRASRRPGGSARRLDAVQLGHPDVHQDRRRRRSRAASSTASPPVLRLADHLDVGLRHPGSSGSPSAPAPGRRRAGRGSRGGQPGSRATPKPPPGAGPRRARRRRARPARACRSGRARRRASCRADAVVGRPRPRPRRASGATCTVTCEAHACLSVFVRPPGRSVRERSTPSGTSPGVPSDQIDLEPGRATCSTSSSSRSRPGWGGARLVGRRDVPSSRRSSLSARAARLLDGAIASRARSGSGSKVSPARRLHDHHAHVVGDHVVQLARDPACVPRLRSPSRSSRSRSPRVHRSPTSQPRQEEHGTEGVSARRTTWAETEAGRATIATAALLACQRTVCAGRAGDRDDGEDHAGREPEGPTTSGLRRRPSGSPSTCERTAAAEEERKRPERAERTRRPDACVAVAERTGQRGCADDRAPTDRSNTQPDAKSMAGTILLAPPPEGRAVPRPGGLRRPDRRRSGRTAARAGSRCASRRGRAPSRARRRGRARARSRAAGPRARRGSPRSAPLRAGGRTRRTRSTRRTAAADGTRAPRGSPRSRARRRSPRASASRMAPMSPAVRGSKKSAR